MEPQTRRQLDTVLGWVGYSLSYTEQDSTAMASAPMLGDAGMSRAPVARRAPTAVPSKAGTTNAIDRKEVAIHMLEAFAEGLHVCGRFAARLVRTAYLYTRQRVREYRDRDEAIQSASDGVVRPSLRERLDDGLEGVLDALETRALALNPMPAIRRVRAACISGANERIDRMAEQISQLATKLSPRRAVRYGREAVAAKRESLEAKVSAAADGVTKRADQVVYGVRGLVSRDPDAPVDRDRSVDAAPVARVRWPEPDHDQAQRHDHEESRKDDPEANRGHRTDVVESESVAQIERPAPKMADASVHSFQPDPALQDVVPEDARDKFDEELVQPIGDREQGRPSFFDSLRWSSLLEFFRPRERHVPSLFDSKVSLEVASEVQTDETKVGEGDAAPEDVDRSVWPERSALERLEMMLSSNADLAAPPPEPENSKGHEQR